MYMHGCEHMFQAKIHQIRNFRSHKRDQIKCGHNVDLYRFAGNKSS